MFDFGILEIVNIICLTFLMSVLIMKLLETNSIRMERRLKSLLDTTKPENPNEMNDKSLFSRIYQMLKGSVSEIILEQQRKGRLSGLELKIKQSGKNISSNEVWTQIFIFTIIGLFLGIVSRKILFVFILTAVGAYIPVFRLKEAIEKRQAEFITQFPNFLDLVAITFPNTNNIEQTFRIVCNEYDNVVSDEFRTVVNELDLGREKRLVYKDLVDRVGLREVSTLVNQIHQAEMLGTGLQDVLNTQARVIRSARKNTIIEKGGRAGLMIYLPAFFFLFIFIAVILFPFVVPIVRDFSNVF